MLEILKSYIGRHTSRLCIDRVLNTTSTDIAVDTTYSKHDQVRINVFGMMIDGVEEAHIAMYENIKALALKCYYDENLCVLFQLKLT